MISKLFIVVMKYIKSILFFLIVLSFVTGTTQVLTNGAEDSSDDLVADNGTPNHSLVRKNYDTYEVLSSIDDNTDTFKKSAEDLLIDLEVVSKEMTASSNTVLTLLGNNLRIHQVLNQNKLITIKEVQFVDDIKFYDHLGQLVSTALNVIPKQNSIILDLNSFRKGIYFLKFEKHNIIKRIRIH